MPPPRRDGSSRTGSPPSASSSTCPPPTRPPALAEADAAAVAEHHDDRLDARDLPIVTLDPVGQHRPRPGLRGLGSTATTSSCTTPSPTSAAFVARDGALAEEVWRRGVTIYAPDGRIPLHPPVLSEGAASLLPAGDRLAVLLTVLIDGEGACRLRSAERAIVRSRAKLAYETVLASELPPLLGELARRMTDAEERRGAGRIEFPAPEIVADPSVPGGLTVRAKPRAPSEDLNANLSLAANLAVAQRMLDAGVGLFRVMADAPPDSFDRLHRIAMGLGVAWPKGESLRDLSSRLDPSDPRQAAFLRSVRQAGGGATYATVDAGPPWHSVIAAPYAHATAPLRRLADRYVLDLVCELEDGRASPDTVAALPALAEVMERAETNAAGVDRAAIDLGRSRHPARPRRRGVPRHRHRPLRRPHPHPAGRPAGAGIGRRRRDGAGRGDRGAAERGRCRGSAGLASPWPEARRLGQAGSMR